VTEHWKAMDKNFYEFWAQFFSSLGKGQKQIDDLNQWLHQGFSGSDALSSIFRKAYGLEDIQQNIPPGMNLWEKSTEAFQKSLKEYLALFDVVSQEDYQNLLNECQALKEKMAKQEETIEDLRKRRGKKRVDPEETVEGLQEVIKKQNDQFQELMKTVGDLFQTSSKS
jgi:predicted  nucleic acid-binding Zn-ribbon protein